MDLFSLEEKLSSFGSGGFYLLETFLIQLLKLEAKANSQELIVEKHQAWDAFAPKGLGKIHQPLYIEISQNFNLKKLNVIAKRVNSKGSQEFNLLLVSTRHVAKSKEALENIPSELFNRVYVWDGDKIQSLMNEHREAVKSILDNLFSTHLKMAVSRRADEWQTDREILIKDLTEKYHDGRFSLILGAGVSSSAGLPDWDTLLNSLFVAMLTDENLRDSASDNDQVSSIVRRLRKVDGPSALMLARYIRKGLSAGSTAEQNIFIKSVTQQLYSLRNKSFSLRSPLIREIASLCTPTRTGAKVHAILTYNFDDLIERELEERGLLFRSIFEEIEIPAQEELPIYHVHGFLPEDRSKYSNLDRCTLVFSEEGYHQIYGDAYHWSNLVQLGGLKENVCLLIGLSLTDPNLRRLLEISSKSLDKPKHYAFLQRLNLEKFKGEEHGSPIRAPLQMVTRFLDRHHSLNEELMRELGINVIWYETYDEIPKILSRIGKVSTTNP